MNILHFRILFSNFIPAIVSISFLDKVISPPNNVTFICKENC